MWLESPGLFVLDFRVCYSQHRSKVLPLMNPIFIITKKLWILAVLWSNLEQSIIFFVLVFPVPSSCWSVAVVMIEYSGLECLLNIVNECHSQIQDYELIYSTLWFYIPCAEFTNKKLVTRWKGKNSIFCQYMLCKKHYHFTIKGRLRPYCRSAEYRTTETTSAQSSQCHRGSYSNLYIHLPTISGK